MCPDERLGGRNDAVLVSGERKNGVTTIVYRRPLQTNEPINDRAIPTDVEVSVIAAIGPLNSRKEANAHATPDRTAGKSTYIVSQPGILNSLVLCGRQVHVNMGLMVSALQKQLVSWTTCMDSNC